MQDFPKKDGLGLSAPIVEQKVPEWRIGGENVILLAVAIFAQSDTDCQIYQARRREQHVGVLDNFYTNPLSNLISPIFPQFIFFMLCQLWSPW
jgi:hypothetical protein